MEWPQIAQIVMVYATGASGALSMVKVIQFLNRRQDAKSGSAAPKNILFVGSREEEIKQKLSELEGRCGELENKNRLRMDDHRSLKLIVNENNEARLVDHRAISEDLRIETRDRVRESRDVRAIIETMAQRLDTLES